MARKRSSFLQDLIELTALAPWWVGVTLAIATYVGLSVLANDTAIPQQAQSAVDVVASTKRSLLHVFVSFGRIIFPIAFLAGAAASAYQRHKRRTLNAVASDPTKGAQAIAGMTWSEFEQLISQVFRNQGWRVHDQHTLPGASALPDDGIDLILQKDGKTYLVQCKHWKASKVGVDVARALLGVVAARKAAGGILITSGHFTQATQDFARNIKAAQTPRIELIDGQRLQKLLTSQPQTPSTTPPPQPTQQPMSSAQATAPQCPSCHAHMVQRTARKGPQVGQSFWGCSAWPKCRATRSIQKPHLSEI